MIPLAHAGHWLAETLYVMPVVVVVTWISIKALLDRYDELNMKLGEDLSPEEMDKVLEEQGRLQDRIDAVNAWDIDSQLELAMDALRCPPPDAEVTTLSGGERRRVALCRLLLQSPDLLLLDEPTNHLDAETTNWLENHLRNYPGAILIVTHDRYFLDNVTGWILELDRGKGIPFEGNYSSWLEQKQTRLAIEEKQSSALQRTLARTTYLPRASISGRFDTRTWHAVVAFQGVNALARDGIVGSGWRNPGDVRLPRGGVVNSVFYRRFCPALRHVFGYACLTLANGNRDLANEQDCPAQSLTNYEHKWPIEADRGWNARHANTNGRDRRGLGSLLVHVHERVLLHEGDRELISDRGHAEEVGAPIAERVLHAHRLEIAVERVLPHHAEFREVHIGLRLVQRANDGVPSRLIERFDEDVDVGARWRKDRGHRERGASVGKIDRLHAVQRRERDVLRLEVHHARGVGRATLGGEWRVERVTRIELGAPASLEVDGVHEEHDQVAVDVEADRCRAVEHELTGASDLVDPGLGSGAVAVELLRRSTALVLSGVTMVALLALSDSGHPAYDAQHAAALSAIGVPSFACTPDLFPDLMAAAIERQDIGTWAASHDIATAHATE